MWMLQRRQREFFILFMPWRDDEEEEEEESSPPPGTARGRGLSFTVTLRLSVLGALSEEARAEAGGKERGGEEGGAGMEQEDDEEVEEEEAEEARGRQWTAMADMLLVYWCCWVLLGRDGLPLRSGSDGGGATGLASACLPCRPDV